MEKRLTTQGTGVTLSLGVASWPADGKTADEIVSAADGAMYRSKHSGGNRVSTASEASLPEEWRLATNHPSRQ